MKLVKSELELKEFFILNSKYTFNDINEATDIKTLFAGYDIDIDFIPRLQDNEYFIYIKVSINEIDIPLPGYSMFVEGVCLFGFNEIGKLDENIKNQFVWTSGVSIAINNIRNFICSQSSHFPFGKFILPSVDLTTLINNKREQLKKNDNKNVQRKSRSK